MSCSKGAPRNLRKLIVALRQLKWLDASAGIPGFLLCSRSLAVLIASW
jgi:hypothetical protein